MKNTYPLHALFMKWFAIFILYAAFFNIAFAESSEGRTYTENFSNLYNLYVFESQPVVFPKNMRYAVYSGPGEDYLRGAHRKAAVSTNAPIQVLGRKDEWILVQYAIDRDHHRIGWIYDDAIQSGTLVGELPSPYCTATLKENALITDDPIYSEAPLVSFPMEIQVNVIARLDDWIYIESTSGDPFCGFVHNSQLILGTVFDFASWPNVGQIGTILANTSAYYWPILDDGYTANGISSDEAIATVLDEGMKVNVLKIEDDWVVIDFSIDIETFGPYYISSEDISLQLSSDNTFVEQL